MINRIEPFQEAPGLLVTPHPSRCRTRRESFRCALQGLRDAWRTQPNLRIHLSVGTVVIGLGVWVHLRLLEWLWVSFAIGLVIFTELMNTAIEQTVDLVVGPCPDPLARSVKDVASGCVLFASLIAALIGCFILGPYLLPG
jgi:diacylglycerol kinase